MARATATPDAARHARDPRIPLSRAQRPADLAMAQAELEAARRAALAVIGHEAVARLEGAAERLALARAADDADTPEAAPARRFVTIAECATLRPFSKAALRDLKFKAFDRTNSRGEVAPGNGTGPAGVWMQIGAKVLIDLPAFDAWLEAHKATAQAGKGWLQ